MAKEKEVKIPAGNCHLCLQPQNTVGTTIGLPEGASICYSCAKKAVEEFESNADLLADVHKKNKKQFDKIPTPRQILSQLNQYVIGQQDAKEILAVSAFSHYKGILARNLGLDVELQKSNILMIGPSGTGKTELVRTLGKILQVPVAICDASTYSATGYVGEDIESSLLKLYQAAHGDIEACERGICFVDEFDKIARSGGNVSITKDVSGECLQNGLLKLLEGVIANVAPEGGRKNPEQKFLQINTNNILFIVAGTFTGIEKIISKRVNKSSSLGFHRNASITEEDELKDSDQLRKQVISTDIVEFGFINEIVGRLPVITTLTSLDQHSLTRILSEPKNSIIKQFETLFDLSNVKLSFTQEALSEVARQSLGRKIGARGLRSIVEKVLHKVQFNIEDFTGCSIMITDKMVRGEEDIVPCKKKRAA